jgi:aspartyl protease family protein
LFTGPAMGIGSALGMAVHTDLVRTHASPHKAPRAVQAHAGILLDKAEAMPESEISGAASSARPSSWYFGRHRASGGRNANSAIGEIFMYRYQSRWALVHVALLSLTATSVAQDKPEDILKAKGIRRVGTYLAMSEETSFSKMFTDVAKLKKAVADANAALEAVEKKASGAKDLINTYAQQRRQLRAQLDQATSIELQNRIIIALNELGDRITLLENADFSKELKEARDKAYQAREAYLQHVLEMRKTADKIQRQYVDLAADAEVKSAMAALSKELGKPYELVESRPFQTRLRDLKKLEDSVLSESIVMRADPSDTYYVPVVINGKHTKELAIDSGASLVCLPHKLAVEVGAEPKSEDETIVLRLADGREVPAKLVKLPSLRVGKFEVENVECAVMPENLTEAAAILGMSYLRNFSFKIDSETGKLTMSKVDAPTRAPR